MGYNEVLNKIKKERICKCCGEIANIKGEEKFSKGKAIGGALLLGPLGFAGGLLTSNTVLICEKCGYSFKSKKMKQLYESLKYEKIKEDNKKIKQKKISKQTYSVSDNIKKDKIKKRLFYISILILLYVILI